MSLQHTQLKSYQNRLLQIIGEQDYQFNQALLKDGLQTLLDSLMDIEVSHILDASRYERNNKRRAYRNGYRATSLQTSAGDITLRIPKLRRGTYYPARLINDSEVITTLLDYIKMSILTEINADSLADSLSALNLMPLSSYNIHQLCDALRDCLAEYDNDDLIPIDVNILPIDTLGWRHLRYLLVMSRHNPDNQPEIVATEETSRLDEEFWQDFTRRMSQAGLMVEGNQPILASINPYATNQLETIHHIMHTNFAQYIHTHFKKYKFQAIA